MFLECIFVLAGLLNLRAVSYNYHDQLIILMLFQSLLLTHDWDKEICKYQNIWAHIDTYWYLMRENKYGSCTWNDFLLCIHPEVQLIYSHHEHRSFPAAHSYLCDNDGVESSSLCPVSPAQKHMDSSAVVPFHTTNQAHRSFWRKSPTARDPRDMFTSHSIHTSHGSSSRDRQHRVRSVC